MSRDTSHGEPKNPAGPLNFSSGPHPAFPHYGSNPNRRQLREIAEYEWERRTAGKPDPPMQPPIPASPSRRPAPPAERSPTTTPTPNPSLPPPVASQPRQTDPQHSVAGQDKSSAARSGPTNGVPNAAANPVPPLNPSAAPLKHPDHDTARSPAIGGEKPKAIPSAAREKRPLHSKPAAPKNPGRDAAASAAEGAAKSKAPSPEKGKGATGAPKQKPAEFTAPKPRGRPFQAGNQLSRGRPKGSLNKTTLLVRELLSEHAEEITHSVISLAKEGNSAAVRAVVDRLCPARPGAPVHWEMPRVECAADIPRACAAVVQAMANGELTLEEGLQATEILERIAKVLEFHPGPPGAAQHAGPHRAASTNTGTGAQASRKVRRSGPSA